MGRAYSRTAVAALASRPERPSLVIADYRLEGGTTGLAVLEMARAIGGDEVDRVVINAQ